MCVHTADIYDSRSDRVDDIYHEINVKNHSSANSLQVPYFLIRRAAEKVTFIANLHTDMRVCECVCIEFFFFMCMDRHMYSITLYICYVTEINIYSFIHSLFVNILTVLAFTHSVDNLLHIRPLLLNILTYYR